MADEPNANHGEILGRMKARIKGLARELADAKAAATAAESKAAKAARDYDENPLKGEVDRLKGELRTDRHRAAFARLAAAAGCKPKAAEHLYALSGLVAEKDEPDEAAMTAALEGLRESADYAFDAPGGGGAAEPGAGAGAGAKGNETITPGQKTPPAAGRGAAHQPGKSGVVVTKAMRADPKFMLNKANAELIAAAAKEHRFTG